MKHHDDPETPRVLSYLELRKAVGIIGCALPFVLSLGGLLFGFHGILCSLSSYYYTCLGNVFVGSLCVIAAFLASCRGYDLRDEIAGYVAGLCAVGVAFCPCGPGGCEVTHETLSGGFHYTFATILFLTLAYYCLCLFRQTTPGKTPTRQKLQRNLVYLVCGWIMLGCIAFMALLKVPAISGLVTCSTRIFWLESVAIVTFGVAWLTKGEALLKDKPVPA